MGWILIGVIVLIIVLSLSDNKKEDYIVWYGDNDDLKELKKRYKSKNEYNYIFKHYSEDVNRETFGGVNYRSDSVDRVAKWKIYCPICGKYDYSEFQAGLVGSCCGQLMKQVANEFKEEKICGCLNKRSHFSWEYYKAIDNAQKRRCRDCGKIDYDYYIPNYYS